jgi:hypothetical protein
MKVISVRRRYFGSFGFLAFGFWHCGGLGCVLYVSLRAALDFGIWLVLALKSLSLNL